MPKQDFVGFIEDNLKGLSIADQETMIESITHDWMPEIRMGFYDKIKGKYRKCPSCKQYSLIDKYQVTSSRIFRENALVYFDSGYGEDDEFADVTYDVEYYICPLCGSKSEKSVNVVKEENRHKRR